MVVMAYDFDYTHSEKKECFINKKHLNVCYLFDVRSFCVLFASCVICIVHILRAFNAINYS